ncbi:hypothetical protein BV25DRAFT_968452 [Artomyces pyxidatus]|uniref:Uncharacterized protein n=1 Tax=Artomyces pyxidatus TaxID=48021 RepID=A0ACB8SX04_9AGAM|nr:hypothetical protein BV25DRAFT_968452 [Artomyces pyxidatus]
MDAPAGIAASGSTEMDCYIARLSQQVLLKIFSYLPMFSRREQEDCTPVQVPTGIAIYQVSQLWRRVILEAPELWTTIPLHMPHWAVCALLYSRDAAISVHVDFGRVRHSAAYRKTVKHALHHLHRVRELSFTWSAESLRASEFTLNPSYVIHVQEITEMLNQFEAPLLKSFIFADLPVYMQGLPDDIFREGPLPRLRHLCLSHVDILTTSALFRAPLDSLQLTACAVVTEDEDEDEDTDEEEEEEGEHDPLFLDSRSHLENILDVLRALPTLRHSQYAICG